MVYEGPNLEMLGNMAEEQEENREENNVYSFEKQQEKHLHIYKFLGTKQDELYLSVRVSGFIWGRA